VNGISIVGIGLGLVVCTAGIFGFIVLFGDRLAWAMATMTLIGGTGMAVGVRNLRDGKHQSSGAPIDDFAE
jgi:hypothetical protein